MTSYMWLPSLPVMAAQIAMQPPERCCSTTWRIQHFSNSVQPSSSTSMSSAESLSMHSAISWWALSACTNYMLCHLHTRRAKDQA